MASSAAISTQAFRPVDWRRTAHILNAPNRAKCQLRENRGNLQFLKSISDFDASEGHSLALERTWEGCRITACAHSPPPHPVPQPRGGPCRERRNRKETRCATGANRSERSFPTPTAAAALRFFKTALSDVSDNLTRRPQCRWLPHRWRPAGCQRKWLQPPSSNCMIVRCTGHAICR